MPRIGAHRKTSRVRPDQLRETRIEHHLHAVRR